jgi:hypothetical protein
MEYEMPSSLSNERVIRDLLNKQKFASGDDIYTHFAKLFHEPATMFLCEEVRKNLDNLFEKGQIARYELNLPENLDTSRLIDTKFDKYIYFLVKNSLGKH